MKLSKIASSVGQFLAKNGRGIGAVAATAVAYALNDRYAAPMQPPIAGKPNGQAQIIYFPPRNAAEAAIDALRQSAAGMWSDSDKLKAVKDILAIASASGVEDSTKAYAIGALTDISNGAWSSACKHQISDMIVQLTKLPKGGA